MNNQGFPNYFQFPIIDIKDGGSLQNEDCVPEYFNKDELFNNPLYFLKKDENGSKIIQDLYKKSSQNDKNIIFDKIKSDIKELSKNAFANYFLVELIKDNDNEKINFLYNTLKDDLYEFSSDSHGTYVIQELLKKLDQNIIEELSDKFFSCFDNQNFEKDAFNINLNHVLQIFIKRHKMEKNDSIYEKIMDKFDVYSKDKYGSYIIQALLTNCKDEQYDKIYIETCKKFKELIKHEFGNYLIVFFLENDKNKDNREIYKCLNGGVFEYSCNKNSARSIEKAYEKGNEEQRTKIIEEILKSNKTKNNEEYIIYLTKDKIGNYVVKYFLEYSDENTRNIIIKKIKSVKNIELNESAQYVLKKIEQLNNNKNGTYINIISGNY